MFRRLLVLPLLCGICWAGPPKVDPESVEPPLGYSLQIGDEIIRLHEGKPVKVPGMFANPQVKLLSDAFRTFPFADISFRYPKYFAFEADVENNAARAWTLTGNTGIIRVYHFTEMVPVTAIIDGLVDEYGKQNCQVSPSTIALAGKKLSGQQVRAKLTMSVVIQQEFFPLPTSAGSHILMLQDTPRDDGTQSDERKLLGKLLSESFSISKSKQH